MSILFTLAMFLLFITISYLRQTKTEAAKAPEIPAGVTPPPEMIREMGFEIPKGFAFHPGHTWAVEEPNQTARIGLDSFAATLFGKVDTVDRGTLNRWVRQGQKIMTLRHDGLAVDVVSPVEGIVTAANPKVQSDPDLISKDPYGEGWVLMIHTPDLSTNFKNLIRGSLVRTWMQNTVERFRALSSPLVGALAQDGGMPVRGLLGQVDPGLREAMIREFFLTETRS
jgi:glycine cleavage system H lipoate-binding protein